MISLQQYIDIYSVSLDEAVRQSDFPRAAQLIRKYLTNHLGKTFFYPEPEVFTPRGGHRQVGIKLFFGGNKALRLNWKMTINQSQGLSSMDFWDGSITPQPRPSHHIEFDESQSLAKVLPFVVEYAQGKVKNSGIFVNEETEQGTSVTLSEANYTEADLSKTVTNMINAFKKGIQVRQQHNNGGNKKYGPRWTEAQKAAKDLHPQLFVKQGASITISPENAAKLDHGKILSAISDGDGAVKFKVSAGRPETVDVPNASEEDIERMTYEEQLDSLKTGMKLMMSNATNAIFVGGRGGCLSPDTEVNLQFD